MPEPSGYRFNDYYVDTAARLLWCNGERVPLTPRVFATLLCLVKAAGRLVTKEELMEAVWPDANVEEGNLTQSIWALRRALGDSEFIETVPKRGYRFAIQVEEVRAHATESSGAELASEPMPSIVGTSIVKKRTPLQSIAVLGVLSITIAFGYLIFQRLHSTPP